MKPIEELDLIEVLKQDNDEIAHELSVVETKKGKMFIVLSLDHHEKVGELLSHAIMNFALGMGSKLRQLEGEKGVSSRRIIPVTIMPDLSKL